LVVDQLPQWALSKIGPSWLADEVERRRAHDRV
jgi:hypothetical protein